MFSILLAPLLLVALPVLGAPAPHNDGVDSRCGCAKSSAAETVQAALAPGPTGINGNGRTAPQAIPAPNRGPDPAVVPEPDTAVEPEANATFPHGRGFTNAVYFTNWGIYGSDYQPQQLPASEISQVLYAFADIAADGEVKGSDPYADTEKRYPTDSWNDVGNNAYGCIKQLYLIKKKHRHLKVLLSIGGWSYSSRFPPMAATEAGRQRFASSAVKLMGDWGFDGLDIDWEYPANPSEAQDFVLLLQACRRALDAYAAQHAPGYRFRLTIATSAGAQHYRTLNVPAMDASLDAWHIMAYDYAGSWDATTGHQANLFASASNPAATKFSTEQAVRDYLAAGVAPHKLVLGMPLYGRAFQATAGPGQSYSGVGAGGAEPGVWLYRQLPRPGATEAWDDAAKASYSYDAATKELITYDTVQSVQTKGRFVVGKGLGGAVFWEASGDKKGRESLVGAVKAAMAGGLEGGANLLSFPGSQYENLRKGMPGE
ncbi:family 18 glycosyl hydrolase [Schizothecium vesticola]|uniref:chitinase n=1 Tax=Schizothecium vesticola TaxID=314040 RepID=A0AA40EV66_9PEZI|nr:family 18 glycosyl hydrolase [Schizothecium vesticola]